MIDPSEWPRDVERLRSLVARRLGLHFDDGKVSVLADALRRRAEARAETEESYLARLEHGDGERAESFALAQELTVTETYFFRHREQFQAFAEVAVPDRMRAQASRRKLRVLSAGCASGEEAYSLAILLKERVADPSWELSVHATDINGAMLERARSGRYSAWSLRDTPQEVGKAWFKPHGREFTLHDSIRAAVSFEARNLADENPDLWRPQSYDIVFCRNMLMYFTPESAQALVARIARALAPGGYLFLGYAETLRGLSNDFHLRHTHGAFYYQRRGDGEPAVSGHALGRAAPDASRVVEPSFGPDDWVDSIGRAAERIRALAQAPTSAKAVHPAATPAAATEQRSWDLAPAIELLGKERFAEALTLVRALPTASTRDPDVLLLRALLLTHGGQLARAEETCRELLVLDELNAGAHYLLALCCEGEGERGRERAKEHDRIALYLDPGFAMARLHLGLLARRAGDSEGARRELSQALTLLQREEASRLMLFGGGFDRAALVALCRAELATAGGGR